MTPFSANRPIVWGPQLLLQLVKASQMSNWRGGSARRGGWRLFRIWHPRPCWHAVATAARSLTPSRHPWSVHRSRDRLAPFQAGLRGLDAGFGDRPSLRRTYVRHLASAVGSMTSSLFAQVPLMVAVTQVTAAQDPTLLVDATERVRRAMTVSKFADLATGLATDQGAA